MKLTTTAIGLLATSALLAGCGGGGDSSSNAGGGDETQFVDGATFTMALSADPGNLDPQSQATSALFAVSQFAYDALVSVNGKTGEIQSQLAKDWNVDGKK